jgi:hypothetical protein
MEAAFRQISAVSSFFAPSEEFPVALSKGSTEDEAQEKKVREAANAKAKSSETKEFFFKIENTAKPRISNICSQAPRRP